MLILWVHTSTDKCVFNLYFGILFVLWDMWVPMNQPVVRTQFKKLGHKGGQAKEEMSERSSKCIKSLSKDCRILLDVGNCWGPRTELVVRAWDLEEEKEKYSHSQCSRDLVCSFIHSLTHSLIHPSTHSPLTQCTRGTIMKFSKSEDLIPVELLFQWDRQTINNIISKQYST
jgi:hypothetical protein